MLQVRYIKKIVFISLRRTLAFGRTCFAEKTKNWRFQYLATQYRQYKIIMNHFQESISCDKTGASVGQNGVIVSQTNYVTLKYVTDSWGTDENGFKMVITAFKSVTQRGCHNSFQCSSPNTCISHDLVCDGKSHCMDGSDPT